MAAAALVVIVGIVAYSGHLPGPFQGAAHVVIGAPSAGHQATGRPSPSATGVGGLNLSSATPAAPATSTTATTAAPSPGHAAAPTPKQICEAFLKDPWWPGAKSGDKPAYEALLKAAGGLKHVIAYCAKALGVPVPQWPGNKGSQFPNGVGGTPAGSPAVRLPGQGHGNGPGPGTGSPGTGGGAGASSPPSTSPTPGASSKPAGKP